MVAQLGLPSNTKINVFEFFSSLPTGSFVGPNSKNANEANSLASLNCTFFYFNSLWDSLLALEDIYTSIYYTIYIINKHLPNIFNTTWSYRQLFTFHFYMYGPLGPVCSIFLNPLPPGPGVSNSIPLNAIKKITFVYIPRYKNVRSCYDRPLELIRYHV